MKSNPGRFSALVWWLSAAASGQEARRGLLWLVWLVMASRSRDILIAGGGSAGTAAARRATLSPAQMLGEEKSLSATPRYRWTAPLSSSCSGHVDSPLSGFGLFSLRDTLLSSPTETPQEPESAIQNQSLHQAPASARASRAFLIFCPPLRRRRRETPEPKPSPLPHGHISSLPPPHLFIQSPRPIPSTLFRLTSPST